MKLFDLQKVIAHAPEMLAALPLSLLIAAATYLAALVIAIVSALIKIYQVPFLKYIVNLYVTVMRSIPMVVMLYLVSYGIPRTVHYFNVTYGLFENTNPNLINPVIFALPAFSFVVAAYLTEIIRASVEAVGEGQFEAAKSVGMTTFETLKRIVLPQAIKIAVPMLGNMMISTIKNTSFLYLIGIQDFFSAAKTIGYRVNAQLEFYIFAAFVYYGVCFALEKGFQAVEKRFRKSDRVLASNLSLGART